MGQDEPVKRRGTLTRVLHAGSQMERLFVRVAPRRSLDVVEMGTNETIKQAVMAGLGIAFISQHTCIPELADGKLVCLRLKGLPIVRQWSIVRRADCTPPKTADVFGAFVTTHSAELIPTC